MAEQQSTTALVPVEGEYILGIREFDASGKTSTFSIPVPRNFRTADASAMIVAGLLKSTTWKNHPFALALYGVMYAERMGLDIMAGDVYPTPDGKLATTANAKIRHALGSGRILGYSIDISTLGAVELPWKTANDSGVFKTEDLLATVTVKVKGWDEPITYKAKLSEWFEGRNPNWKQRPEYMLRKNALSKALEEVAPMGVEDDAAPDPLPPVVLRPKQLTTTNEFDKLHNMDTVVGVAI